MNFPDPFCDPAAPEESFERAKRIFEAYRQEADRLGAAKVPLPNEATPGHLLHMSRKNTVLATVLQMWRRGTMPLENALILCISMMDEERTKLYQTMPSTFGRPTIVKKDR